MKKEVKIGLFTITMIIVAWAGIRFLSGTDLLSSDNYYYAHYDQINGVQKSSVIYIRGVKVGTVTKVSLDATHSGGVVIELSVASKYNIPTNSEAKIFSSSIMGPKAVEIILGDEKHYLESGDIITSTPNLDLLGIASSELSTLKEELDKMTSELTSTLTNINTLLESNTEHISGLLTNLEGLTYNLNTLVVNNEPNITQTIEGFAELSQTLGENSTQIDSIIMNINTITTNLNDANVGTTLSTSLVELTTLLEKINNEEGSIGKMIGGNEFYNNLTSASAGLDSLFSDMKMYPNRYIHFSVFGRDIEKLNKKAERQAAKEARKAK
ncbi:MAG: MlaD family protein [Rikenellaceae bacterium]